MSTVIEKIKIKNIHRNNRLVIARVGGGGDWTKWVNAVNGTNLQDKFWCTA